MFRTTIKDYKNGRVFHSTTINTQKSREELERAIRARKMWIKRKHHLTDEELKRYRTKIISHKRI